MKRFWFASTFLAVVGLAVSLLTVSCGPQEAFCPNTGDGGVCPIVGDEKSAPVTDSGGGNVCPGGEGLIICNGKAQCPPCN